MAFNPEATMEKILYHGDRIRYYDIRNGEFYYIDESNDRYTYHKINVTTGVDQLVALQGCPFNVLYGGWSYFSSIGHDTGLFAVNNNDYYEYIYYVYAHSFTDGTSRLLFETRIEYELSRI